MSKKRYLLVEVNEDELNYELDYLYESLDKFDGVEYCDILESLNKLEISSCLEAVIERRDSINQDITDGVILPDDIELMNEMVCDDIALIEKLQNIWKSMPIDSDNNNLSDIIFRDYDKQYLDNMNERLEAEHNSLMEEIAQEVTSAMINIGFMNPDPDVVGEIAVEVYKREYGDSNEQDIQIDLRDRSEIIDEIMAERYL